MTHYEALTPRARKVIDIARREGLVEGLNYIDTEQLLLGLIREGDGVAARVLRELGVSGPVVRAAVHRILRETP